MVDRTGSSKGSVFYVPDKTLCIYAAFWRSATFDPSRANRIHEGFTDSACRSPSHFADARASRSTVLYDSILRSKESKCSKVDPHIASRTETRSHEGTIEFITGLRRLAPFRNRTVSGCALGVAPVMPS